MRIIIKLYLHDLSQELDNEQKDTIWSFGESEAHYKVLYLLIFFLKFQEHTGEAGFRETNNKGCYKHPDRTHVSAHSEKLR